MSERPEAPTSGQHVVQLPAPMFPRSIWGSQITWPSGGSAKLVIDENGKATFTDPAGETGHWDDLLFGWVDDGYLKDYYFGPPGFEPSEEQRAAAVQRLDAAVAALSAQIAADPTASGSSPEAALLKTLSDRVEELRRSDEPG